jgi:hypothetical protein
MTCQARGRVCQTPNTNHGDLNTPHSHHFQVSPRTHLHQQSTVDRASLLPSCLLLGLCRGPAAVWATGLRNPPCSSQGERGPSELCMRRRQAGVCVWCGCARGSVAPATLSERDTTHISQWACTTLQGWQQTEQTMCNCDCSLSLHRPASSMQRRPVVASAAADAAGAGDVQGAMLEPSVANTPWVRCWSIQAGLRWPCVVHGDSWGGGALKRDSAWHNRRQPAAGCSLPRSLLHDARLSSSRRRARWAWRQQQLA